MAKTGRNDPCPCGSGKKYKQCCLARDAAAAHAARAAQAAAAPAHRLIPVGFPQDEPDDLDALTAASNAVPALIRAGQLDAAEQAARDLLARFPEVHDGYDRLGMVCEARGEHRQAAEYYRQVIAFVRDRPDQYDPAFATVFEDLVARLDPPDPCGSPV